MITDDPNFPYPKSKVDFDRIIPKDVTKKDWYRLLRMIAIDRHHILQLFRQVFGLKEFSFDDVLKEIAEDFDVPLKELQNVKFARFE